MRPSQVDLYDALYALASDEGRDGALFGRCAPLARKAFQRSLFCDEMPFVWFELPLMGAPRFDLLRDGTLGTTIGISAGFAAKTASSIQPLFMEGKPATTFFEKVEHLGLADRRWQHIPRASFTKLVKFEGSPIVLSCVPTFVKLRLRDGKQLDAKVYLQAGSWTIDKRIQVSQ